MTILKTLREQKNIPLSHIAKQVGYSETHIQDVEMGNCKARRCLAFALATLLDESPEDLFSENGFAFPDRPKDNQKDKCAPIKPGSLRALEVFIDNFREKNPEEKFVIRALYPEESIILGAQFVAIVFPPGELPLMQPFNFFEPGTSMSSSKFQDSPMFEKVRGAVLARTGMDIRIHNDAAVTTASRSFRRRNKRRK